ncbi:MAG: hypothetical protein AAB289_09860, partial [Chloroflexota bacterium]
MWLQPPPNVPLAATVGPPLAVPSVPGSAYAILVVGFPSNSIPSTSAPAAHDPTNPVDHLV